MTHESVETDAVTGLLLVDKPAGVTSHDVVDVARRAYRERSIGHLGTLDPFATGLLVLLFGRATRLSTFIDNEPKVYEATIQFGTETDTDDVTGSITRTAPLPEPELLIETIPSLTGEIDQTPPAYSAKKIDGKPAYRAARAGVQVQLAPATVHVYQWDVHAVSPSSLSATIVCGGGTYIRALARDLGRLAGTAAHLATLRRTRSGDFDVKDAAPLERLRSAPPPPLRHLRIVAE